jgi:hypothetical protein
MDPVRYDVNFCTNESEVERTKRDVSVPSNEFEMEIMKT